MYYMNDEPEEDENADDNNGNISEDDMDQWMDQDDSSSNYDELGLGS
jgi:hypothetical protein